MTETRRCPSCGSLLALDERGNCGYCGAHRPDAPRRAVCYRHPERGTGVRCQRCERPICTDCMMPAPVGFHCVECVRAPSRPAYLSARSSPHWPVGSARTLSIPPKRGGGAKVLYLAAAVIVLLGLLGAARLLAEYGPSQQGQGYRAVVGNDAAQFESDASAAEAACRQVGDSSCPADLQAVDDDTVAFQHDLNSTQAPPCLKSADGGLRRALLGYRQALEKLLANPNGLRIRVVDPTDPTRDPVVAGASNVSYAAAVVQYTQC